MRPIDADTLVQLYEQDMKNNLIDKERGIDLSHLVTKEDVDFFKAFIDKVPTFSPWRDAENDTPETARQVIVQDKFGNTYMACYFSTMGGWECYDYDAYQGILYDVTNIVRWMDIPQ